MRKLRIQTLAHTTSTGLLKGALAGIMLSALGCSAAESESVPSDSGDEGGGVVSAELGSVFGPVAQANRTFCPPGSQHKKVNLSGVELQREEGITLQYAGFNNVEGPLWHDGALYYTNMGNHAPDANGFVLTNQTTLWRWQPGSAPTVWLDDTKAGTNGLAVDFKGKLVAARQLD